MLSGTQEAPIELPSPPEIPRTIAQREAIVRREFVKEGKVSRQEASTLPAIAELCDAYVNCAEALLRRAQSIKGLISLSPSDGQRMAADFNTCMALHALLYGKAARLHWNDEVVASDEIGDEMRDVFLRETFIHKKSRIDTNDVIAQVYGDTETQNQFLHHAPALRQATYKAELELMIAFRRNGDFAMHPKGATKASHHLVFQINEDFMYSSLASFLPPETRAPFTNKIVVDEARPSG